MITGGDAEPVLPEVGQVFWIDKELIQPPDKRASEGGRRPAVVVDVPFDVIGRIWVVTRTSDLDRRPGVRSPADLSMRLDVDGVWGYLRTVEALLWTVDTAQHVGTLDDVALRAIQKEFGL